MNRAYFTNLQIGYRLNQNLIKYRKIAKTGKCYRFTIDMSH